MIESSTWRHRCQACPWSWRGQPNPARWEWGCQCRCRWVKHPTKKPCWDGRPSRIDFCILLFCRLAPCIPRPWADFSIIFIDRFQAKWVGASRMLLVGPSRQLRLLRASLATKCIKALVPLLVECVRRWQVWHGEGEKRNCSQCSLRFPEVVSFRQEQDHCTRSNLSECWIRLLSTTIWKCSHWSRATAVKPAVTCSVCGASCGASCLLRKEELKDDAKKLAEKAKTALHGVHNT